MPANVTTAFGKEEFPESRKRVPGFEGEKGRAKQELEGPRAGNMGCGVLLLTDTTAFGDLLPGDLRPVLKGSSANSGSQFLHFLCVQHFL